MQLARPSWPPGTSLILRTQVLQEPTKEEGKGDFKACPLALARLQMFLLASEIFTADFRVWLIAGLLMGEGKVPPRITRDRELKVLGSKASALGRKLAGFHNLMSSHR